MQKIKTKLLPRRFAVLRRRLACVFGEKSSEVCLELKAGFFGNVLQRQGGTGEQVPGFFNPLVF